MNKFCQHCGGSLQGTEQTCPRCGGSVVQTVQKQPVQPAMQQPTMPQSTMQMPGQPMMQQPVMPQPTMQMPGQPMMQQPQMNYGAPYGYAPTAPIQSRSIVTAIILSIVTCGIYGIYWFVCMTNEANQASGEQNATSGGTALIFTILTCGLYSFYWAYKMGERMAVAGQRYGKPIENRSVLYLILSFVGLGIVGYCLIQDDLNKLSA